MVRRLGDRGGLDAEKPAELDLVGIEILAVNDLEQHVVEGGIAAWALLNLAELVEWRWSVPTVKTHCSPDSYRGSARCELTNPRRSDRHRSRRWPVNDRGIWTPHFREKVWTKITPQTGSSFHEKSQSSWLGGQILESRDCRWTQVCLNGRRLGRQATYASSIPTIASQNRAVLRRKTWQAKRSSISIPSSPPAK
ncbi:hypothetical protein SAMN02927914_05961 [Mesorhizobium qingshengii]|uniref:Uncharacterized protein n=1 Tax=Mesorhizobium qingshengii TaxID=1165689 RepID=A0A1G5ZSD0_9HYPH|nr:hypothetical protein SAMN02927914_05961 [Mesorhizobium qingshengii]